MNCLKNKKSLIVNELHPRKCTDKKAEQLEELIDEKSYLLSGELATKLTGRYIEFEMFTLSFEEYIKIVKPENLVYDGKKIHFTASNISTIDVTKETLVRV